MKFLDAVNKAYEKAHTFGGSVRISRKDKKDDLCVAYIYGDGIGTFRFDEFSVEDLNADDWNVADER